MSEARLSHGFRSAFADLRRASHDNPQSMLAFYKDHPALARTACRVDRIASEIERISAYRKTIPQVSVEFISEWKAYQLNWRSQVAYVAMCSLWDSVFGDDVPPSFEDFNKRKAEYGVRVVPEPQIDDCFSPGVHDGGAAVRMMMDFAKDQAQYIRENAEEASELCAANIQAIGVESLEHFEKVIGIDIEAAYRRWDKLPTVFVPKHVSDRHGLTEKGSLYAMFDEAIRAYVAGAPGAAVALCRAILETVLRDHYLANDPRRDGKLGKVVEIAAERYGFLSRTKLDALREGANRVLHAYSATGELSLEDEATLLKFFKDLKFYIEKAPAK